MECDECHLKFASERLRDKHKDKEHSPEVAEGEENDGALVTAPSATRKQHVCHVCGNSFQSAGKLREHMVSNHEDGTQPTETCPVCAKIFKYVLYFCLLLLFPIGFSYRKSVLDG